MQKVFNGMDSFIMSISNIRLSKFLTADLKSAVRVLNKSKTPMSLKIDFAKGRSQENTQKGTVSRVEIKSRFNVFNELMASVDKFPKTVIIESSNVLISVNFEQ